MSTGVHWKRRAVAVVLFSLLAASMADAQQSKKDWEFTVAPYGWAIGIGGDVGIRDFVTDVDLSFTDLLEDLRFATMLRLGARYDRWRGTADLIFASIGKERTFLHGEHTRDVDFELDVWIVHPMLGYAVYRSPSISFEVTGGARYWNLQPELSLARVGQPARSASETIAWADATLGARWALQTTKRWSFELTGNGGAGGANNSWEGIGLVAYDLSTRWKLGAGYRYLSVDYDQKERLIDIQLKGLLLGAEYRF